MSGWMHSSGIGPGGISTIGKGHGVPEPKPFYLAQDNSSIHTSSVVKAWFCQHPEIKLCHSLSTLFIARLQNFKRISIFFIISGYMDQVFPICDRNLLISDMFLQSISPTPNLDSLLVLFCLSKASMSSKSRDMAWFLTAMLLLVAGGCVLTQAHEIEREDVNNGDGFEGYAANLRQLHECVKTPPKCSNEGGFCLNLQLSCAGKMNASLCNNDNCGCCLKHECINTPKICSSQNGVCINLMDDCAGQTDESLCRNKNCKCCMKHECSNTPKMCSNEGGTCINLMDDCAGKADESLCRNQNCKCCIKHECSNTPKMCSNEGGVCINLMDDCPGKANESLCRNQNCKCCMKHECSNTPKMCSNEGGTCINLMDDCAGKVNESLCRNQNCKCCMKHECSNTPKLCSNEGGVCINLMDDCPGKANESLCRNRNCKCCIKHECSNTPKMCSNEAMQQHRDMCQ
ncbi:protein psiQ-like [Penaeus vannamei]|uniref:protein psiQ-like n=1 Tax=Penaeus vannamei TaxID=6689 RepID=UPI00387F4BDA